MSVGFTYQLSKVDLLHLISVQIPHTILSCNTAIILAFTMALMEKEIPQGNSSFVFNNEKQTVDQVT